MVVSEDREGKGKEVTAVIDRAAAHLRQAGAASVEHVVFPDSGGGPPGDGRLARHYKWALSSMFAKPGEPPRFRRWRLGCVRP